MFALPVLSADVLKGVALATMAMLTFGCCMVVVSHSLRGMTSGPGSVLAAGASVPAALVVAVVQFTSGSVEMPGFRPILWFAAAGVLSTYLGRWLVFKSIELVGPSRAAGIQCTSPMITALFGWLLLGQMLLPLGLVGIALGIAGLLALSMSMSHNPAPGASSRLPRQGGLAVGSMLVGIGSATAYAASHVLRAVGVHDWNEPWLGAAIGALSGFVVLLIASHRQLAGYARQIRAHPIGARIYVAVGLMQFIAQALVIASMKFIPAGIAALISMSTPLVVVPVSYVFLRKQENLNLTTLAGIGITLAGLLLVVLYGRPEP
ncbi:MAG: DMT family transporter [Rhodoferax sp.]|nr:DMT family transporter [Rhodoferax sp.]